MAAGVDVSTCPVVYKRSNGNGQASLAPGDFRPAGYSQNNPVANNVVGTPYQYVYQNPASKTGNFNFYWDAATPIVNLPVITRCWAAPNISTTATLSPIVFGPPPPPTVVGNRYYANYCFYVQNMPNIGVVTFEFSDPITNEPLFYCTIDLSSNNSTSQPPINCAPTVTTQPSSVALCGSDTARFSVVASGASAYQWQVSPDGSTNWTNVNNGASYSGATTSSLTVINASNYDGKYYRVVLTGKNTCGNINSSAVLLVAKPKPTAAFSGGSNLCGFGSRSLSVNFTGTGTWSFTYTATPSGGSTTSTTVSDIISNPYSFSVSPATTTTYNITAVSDRYCSNSSLTGSVTIIVNPTPSVTPTDTNVCKGSTSFPLKYTATGSPNQYSITAGTRSLSGFSAVSYTRLGTSPLSISIPSSAAAGTYDFNITVKDSITGCTSTSMPFTVTIKALPVITASANTYSICSGGSVTLSAAGASTYSWSSSPSGFTSSLASPSVSPTATTTYSVTGTSNGCNASSSTSVTVSNSSNLSITGSASTICTGNRVSLTVSGANTYSWSGPSSYSATGNSVIVSPTATGAYSVTGSNSSGCSATASYSITVTSGPSVTVTPSAPTICLGASTTLTASGATSYSWTPSTGLSSSTGSSVTANPTATTTYTVYGTTGSCTSTNTVTVTVTASKISGNTQVIYCGGSLKTGNDFISDTITIASPGAKIRWQHYTGSAWSDITSTATSSSYSRSEDSSTASLTKTAVRIKNAGGTYTVRAFVLGGTCADTFNITFKDLSIAGTRISLLSNQTICSGSTPTALSVDGIGRKGSVSNTFTFQWQRFSSGGAATNVGTNSTTYTPSSAYTVDSFYRVLISTSSSCTTAVASDTVKITIANAVTGNTISVSDSCSAGASISGTGSVSGGNGTFTYSWESSTTSASAGFSTVVGAASSSYTPPIPTVTNWYRRLITSGTCSNSASNVVVVHPQITSTQISNGQTVCFGVTLDSLSASPSGGSSTASFTYLWYSSTDNSNFTSTGVTTSKYAPTTAVGTKYYKVTISKGACSVTSNTAIVIINSNPTVSVSPSLTSLCSGSSVSLTASGAVSYSWSPATDLSATSGALVTSTPTASRTYTITGTDSYGCTATAKDTVNYLASPSNPTLSSSSKTICSGSTTNLNSLITSGGTNEWFTAPEANASYLVASPTLVSVAGTYYVFQKSGSCYSPGYSTLTLTVNDVSAPNPADTLLNFCSPATANLTALQPAATSGTVLRWHTVSSNPTNADSVVNPSSVGAGSYYLYAYSTAGLCYGPASKKVTINIYSPTNASLTSHSISVCEPSNVDLRNYYSTSVGNSYDWYSSTPPSSSNIVGAPFDITQSGKYYLFITNSNGCRGNADSIQVTVNPLPSVDISSPASVCGGASRSITVTADSITSSYQWQVKPVGDSVYTNLSNSGVYSGVSTNTLNISNTTGLGGYYYDCIVTSSASCSTTSYGAVIIEETAPSIVSHPVNAADIVGNDTLFSVSITGTPTADYQWQVSTNGGTSYTNLTDNATYSGAYTPILVIHDIQLAYNGYKYKCIISNSCNTLTSNAATLNVTNCAPPTPTFTTYPSSTICANTNATYTTQSGGGQHEYDWSVSGTLGVDYIVVSGGVDTGSHTVTLKWLTSGTKIVTVGYHNSANCQSIYPAVDTTVVNALPSPSISGTNTICSGTTSTFTASGGSSYLWSTTEATAAITVSTAGTYTVTATDGNGCKASASEALTVNALPTPSISGTNAICSGTSSTFTASGGSSYLWSTTEATAAITVSTAGTYTVTATDGNGCTASASRTLTVNALPSPSISGTDTIICSGDESTFIASGGNSYVWSTSEITKAITISMAGLYTVTATDGNGCSASASRTLTVNALPTPSISGTNAICSGTSSTFTASGGTSYIWSSGATTTAITVSTAGTYTVTATDVNGCTATASEALTINALPTVTAVDAARCDSGTLTLGATANAGTLYWYDVASGGTAIDSGVSYTTPFISNTTIYYAEAAQNACITRVPVTATVNKTPTINSTTSAYRCEAGTLDLAATASAGIINWYNAISGGVFIDTGVLYTTPYLTQTQTYYANVTANGCTSFVRVPVKAWINGIQVKQSTSDTTVLQGATARFIVVLEGDPDVTYQWQEKSDTSASGSFINLSNGSQYSGVTTPVLTINAADTSMNNYKYKVVIENSCSTVTTNAARLLVMSGTALPVKWLDFSARQEGQTVVLNWQTAIEYNSKDFVLYQSMDASSWNRLGVVDAAGYSTRVLSYTYTHLNPEPGTNYYKILQRDRDGALSYSKILSLKYLDNQYYTLKVYPNPVQNGIIIIETSKATNIVILDRIGAKVAEGYMETGRSELDINALPSGLYFLKTDFSSITFAIK